MIFKHKKKHNKNIAHLKYLFAIEQRKYRIIPVLRRDSLVSVVINPTGMFYNINYLVTAPSKIDCQSVSIKDNVYLIMPTGPHYIQFT